MKIPMVFGTSIALFGVLFFVKRGKPDGYLQHLAEYLASPTVQFANTNDEDYRQFSGMRESGAANGVDAGGVT